jgi:hypothetical protein
MAYRTLPAFLELIQRSRREGRGVQMRGILLTLPNGELPGGRWERELRGRFGSRILPTVIPHDEEASKATDAGRILSHELRESPAAVAYHTLAASLGLASEEVAVLEGAGSPLLAAAAALEAAGTPVGRHVVSAVATAAPPVRRQESTAAEADIVLPPATVVDTVEETVPAAPAIPAPARRRGPRPTPAKPVPRERPEPILSESEIPDLDELLARQELPRPASRPSRPAVPTRPTAAPPGSGASPVRRTQPAPEVVLPLPPVIPMSGGQPWIVWVGLACVVGVGLRFVPLPDFMLPVIVGVAVADAVVLVLRLVSPTSETDEPPAAPPTPPQPPSKRLVVPSQPVEAKKPASRPVSTKEPGARVSSPARRPASDSQPPRSGERRRSS